MAHSLQKIWLPCTQCTARTDGKASSAWLALRVLAVLQMQDVLLVVEAGLFAVLLRAVTVRFQQVNAELQDDPGDGLRVPRPRPRTRLTCFQVSELPGGRHAPARQLRSQVKMNSCRCAGAQAAASAPHQAASRLLGRLRKVFGPQL